MEPPPCCAAARPKNIIRWKAYHDKRGKVYLDTPNYAGTGKQIMGTGPNRLPHLGADPRRIYNRVHVQVLGHSHAHNLALNRTRENNVNRSEGGNKHNILDTGGHKYPSDSNKTNTITGDPTDMNRKPTGRRKPHQVAANLVTDNVPDLSLSASSSISSLWDATAHTYDDTPQWKATPNKRRQSEASDRSHSSEQTVTSARSDATPRSYQDGQGTRMHRLSTKASRMFKFLKH